MNNAYWRRRVALLLLLVIVVSPLFPTSRAASTPAPLYSPFDGPTEFIRQIPLATNDITFSSLTGKIYASVPSTAGNGGNSITSIDPATGAVESTTFVGSEPNKLALSDDGHSLYVSLDGSASVRRFDVQTNTAGLQFTLGQDSFFGRYFAGDLAVAPGNPDLLAVARSFGAGPSGAGVAVFDNGVRRTNTGSTSDFLAFSASASKLYGSGVSSGGLQTLTIDASGVTVSANSSLAAGARIKFSNGLIFTSQGQVINPDTNSLLGTFANVNTQAFVPDAANGRVYYLTSDPFGGGNFVLKAFDKNTFLLLGSLNISGATGTPTSLLRWGPNGLAFRTNAGQLFILQTSLIPSAEPIPTPTPTVSPTPTPSPTPAAAFVRQMALSTNDLEYNQGTQRLYASVPSSEGSAGNSVAEIDPVMGAIATQVFVGSEPTQLAQADDGSTLYVGLDGAASIRRYNILTHTAGQQFPVGRDTFFGPYSFSDIAVSPGNPSVVAVARQHRQISPPEAGVAIFDNGVQRPNTGPGHIQGSDVITFGSSSSVLYGNNFQGLTTMSIDNSGVNVTGTTRFTVGNSLIFENNLLYGSSGQVLNPATGDLVGSFSLNQFDSAHVIDSANGRAFFLLNGGSTLQLRAFDLNTFLPLGFINISGVNGLARDLVRWGTNGLAFRTSMRQVFLIETPLVNASVPVASPTPTPSPTPSPSPTVIPTFVRQFNIPANDLVFSEATHALYASVPSSAGLNGNSIQKIDPQTGEVGQFVFIGSEPSKIALSSDAQTLWVHLDGANAARRFDLLTQTPGLQFTTGTQRVQDMEVVPGSPQSLVLTKLFGGGVFIYDDGVQRANTAPSSPQVGPIEFGASPSVLYGFNNVSSSFDLVKYLVDSSGVTQQTSTGALLTGNSMKFSNGLLYSTSGRVADPESQTLVGTFQNAGFFSAMTVDAANHRVFYASNDGGSIVTLRAFDSDTFLLVGSINLPGIPNTPVSLVRWGTNGLAFNTNSGGSSQLGRIYVLQSALVSNAAPIPTGLQFETDKLFTFESTGTQTVRVVRTGDISGSVSVDYATSDGTAVAGSDYTVTSGTLNFGPGESSKNISIPITDDNLFENGNETFSVTLSNPTGGAIVTLPSTTLTLQDNDSKPFVFMASNGIRVTEGDSGTQNLAVNVRLSNATIQTVTVDFATSNGTATAGSDYVAASGTVTIPAGTTTVPINIAINGDLAFESDENFTVTLSNPTNVSFLSASNTVVTIADDDATLQLSSNSFTVNESAGEAIVTVTRAGGTAKAATVDFASTDTAGLQSCTVANGKASERCDYGTVVGTLRFAVGQSTKTFTIPIVDDALVEGDETLTVALSGPTAAALGPTTVATITITDNDSSPATQNPVDGVDFFVTQQYIDFLGRLPDPVGFASWTATLRGCPNGGFGEFANPDCDRVHVSAGFFLSEEFRGRGYFAYKFYEVGFDRRPVYAEFIPDMVQVGGPQSPASEALSKAAYTDAFVQRLEFKNRYDALSNTAYVNALEANAEVTLANKAELVEALNTNQKTRAQVLREIVELQSVTDKFFIRAFVAMQYFGYLRRDPDTIGYDDWVAALTSDPSNFRHMIFGFLFSDEYRHRFGP